MTTPLTKAQPNVDRMVLAVDTVEIGLRSLTGEMPVYATTREAHAAAWDLVTDLRAAIRVLRAVEVQGE